MGSAKLSSIKAAIRISEKALADIIPLIRPGIRESYIAGQLFKSIREYGADRFSFRPIIASGARSALPHGRATEKKIKNGDIVVVDFGVVYRGYCSDMTRSFVAGSPSKRQDLMWNILLRAQKKAIQAVKNGVPCRAVDKAARDMLIQEGFGKYFIHSTGHGIAFKVHEAPKISRKNRNVLKSGTVITIEPGIYLKGWGGMRVEDMLLVTDRGAKVLTGFPRKLKAS